jgi:hypothetical protein
MLRKIIVIVAMIALISLSVMLYKKSAPQQIPTADTQEEQVEAVVEEALPEVIYTFNIENVTADCSQENQQFCAVENAVKCTVNPDLEICKNLQLPEFIFMKDPSVDRPSEISYKIVNKKALPNNTTEIYTESACNGNWFGLCQGTVIYVLAPLNEAWQVKDIYAIE